MLYFYSSHPTTNTRSTIETMNLKPQMDIIIPTTSTDIRVSSIWQMQKQYQKTNTGVPQISVHELAE